MYCPAHFAQTDAPTLHALMAQFPLATIVHHTPEGLQADHIPLLHLPDPSASTPGRLLGHVARANPLWRVAPEAELLVVFQGPQAYISPNGYASKASTGKVVPTWNYAVVHAHANLHALLDAQQLRAILHTLTDTHEAAQLHPWHMDDAPDDHIEELLRHIVAVELRITRLQGKFKLSQNQPPANRLSLVEALRGSAQSQDQEMANWVAAQGALAQT